MNTPVTSPQYQPTPTPAMPPAPVMMPSAPSGMRLALIVVGALVVGGIAVFAWTKFGSAPEVIPSPMPTASVTLLPTASQSPTVIASATPDPTAGWKTYTSGDFQVGYPSDWVTPIQNDKPIVYLKRSSIDPEAQIQISLGNDNPGSLSLNDWLATQRWPLASGQTWSDIFRSVQNIDGHPAVMQEPTGSVYSVYGKIVLRVDNGTGFSRKVIPENIFFQILSTFKFTK